MRILVLSTTGHPEANLESARYFIENKSIIDKITVLSTTYMDQQGKTDLLVQSLKLISQAAIEILNIPNGYEESNMFAIQEMILNWANQHPAKDRFIFNITGGTKLMSIAMDRASMLLGSARAESFYQSRGQHVVWYQRQTNQIVYPINSNLNLQQRVLSRGYQITKQQPITDISLEQLRYAQILIDVMKNDFQKGRRFCSFINKLASMSDDENSLNVHFDNIQAEQAEGLEVLAQITQEAFFSFDSISSVIQFKSEETREYMKGGWLEVYSGYECYKALIGLNPQAELAINVELKKKDTPNEMDVMFIHHAHLYCIECKTAKTMAHEQAKDVLYKLSSLQDFGGINQKQAVVSLYSLKDYNLTRANNSEIRIFQERDLLNLSQLISEWLQPKSINISQGISL